MRKRKRKLAIWIWAAAASLAAQVATPVYAARSKEICVSTQMLDQGNAKAAVALRTGLERNAAVESNLKLGTEAFWRLKAILTGQDPSMEKATASKAGRSFAHLKSVSTGDLWDGWEGDLNFPGEGTPTIPYQISTPEHLMGLAEATAAGVDFKGKYFEMIQDIDLGILEADNKSWNPIGWYQNKKELGGSVSHGFSGNFDGCGNTISGLKIYTEGQRADYTGLFGWIDGGSICNLQVEGAQVYGGNRAAILAGAVTGSSRIYNVQVSGYVWAEGDAGGIAGTADGKEGRVTIENCIADGIAVLSEGSSSFTGGIVGQAINADLVDNRVITPDGDKDHIQGKGYTGGIAGRMSHANLYNSYVEGTIGCIGAKAIGGITGMYESGSLILARFAGDIARTYQGSGTKEGTFVGARQGMFTYGTEQENNLSYLFTDTEAKAMTAVGSGQDGDNVFTKNAHIGYWTDHETKFVTVAGVTRTGCGEKYFYEELEDGIRHIVTKKLGNPFTAEGCSRNCQFSIDHFAPGRQGEPVRGYLLSVPRIDAVNANGTYDTDVAVLTAVPAGSNTYYRIMDKEHSAAVAPGEVILVTTAAKNKDGNYYQMVMDHELPGGVKPPVYSDKVGQWIPMTYVNGGNYSFQMPEQDTQIRVEYVKVTTKVELDPAETTISVVQTRKGERKNPDVLTEVRNESGNLIARYINGEPDPAVEIQPVRIHGEHNMTGNTADQSLRWFVDDKDLLIQMSTTEYTLEDARIIPNLKSTFIQKILDRETKIQAENGYLETISPAVYQQSALVTAASNPETSIDHTGVYGNCKVTVTLQILDETIRRAEGLNLNQNDLIFQVTRILSGDRKNPKETFVYTEPVILSADLYPQQPFYKNVTWKIQEGSGLMNLVPTGEFQENCTAGIESDGLRESLPSWIQTVIEEDDRIKKEDPYKKLEGSAVSHETITAVTQDQFHETVKAKCNVTISFKTEDKTEILPEAVKIQPSAKQFELSVVKQGNDNNSIIKYEGFGKVKLQALVTPDCPAEPVYEPYNRSIVWSSQEPEILSVSEKGILEPNQKSLWVQKLIEEAEASKSKKAEGQKTVVVQAETADGQTMDAIEVVLYLTAEDKTKGNYGNSSMGSYTKKVIRSFDINSTADFSGDEDSRGEDSGVMRGHSLTSSMTGSPDLGVKGKQGIWTQDTDGYWMLIVEGRICQDEWVYVQNPYADKGKNQDMSDWFRFDSQGHMVTGWFTDKDGRRYYLNPISDNTKGRMLTGWNWIIGKDQRLRCYYFQEQSNGYKGELLKNTSTPDGYMVNAEGEWIVENKVQTK